METKAGEHNKNIEVFVARFNESEEGLSNRIEKIIAQYNSKIEDYKGDFMGKIGKYIESSEQESRKIVDKIMGMEKELKHFEEKTIENIRNKAVGLEGDLTKKISLMANNFDDYIKKSEKDFSGAVDNSKKDISTMLADLKTSRNTVKEEIINDIKELNKRTREIETRYEGLLKKSAVLERAESMAEKSNKSVEMISQFLKDVEKKRKEIEDAMKSIDQIKSEQKELSGILTTITTNKKESQMIHQTVLDALQKAKETQELLTAIEKQTEKAEGIKATLLDTLKIYEEVKARVADAEKKRDTINKLLDSIGGAKDDVKSINERVGTIDERIGTVNRMAKKIEDDIKSAQTNITKLFGDQDRVSYAVDKIVDIENLLMHIEEESKKVQKMRDWVAKMDTQLERIKDTQEAAMSGHKSGPKKVLDVDRGADEDVIKNILRLKEQSWSIEDISKSLKISRAYVELILERYEE
jgi:chromosome segregation ATPase